MNRPIPLVLILLRVLFNLVLLRRRGGFPSGSPGFRYLLGKRWSLDAEGIFHHVSNAGFGDRNVGVNAFGGLVGVRPAEKIE